jgi:hypothetical protein
VNSDTTKLAVQGITPHMESVLVFLEAEAAHFPLPRSLEPDMFSTTPAIAKALQAHAVNPSGLLLLIALSRPVFDDGCEVFRR